MKALRKTIARLADTIDCELEEMEDNILPASRSYGMSSIRDEVLTRILDFVGASYEWSEDWTEVRKQLLHITKVSKRFRRCASYAHCIQEFKKYTIGTKTGVDFRFNERITGDLFEPCHVTKGPLLSHLRL